ncbi:MAG: phospho-N-acetylmuramoyl-pentapeptide-transferase [Faecalibacterium prausnitzii]|nr:phospho-N-acetylmuramoyl-pentapeptide-transferase [Faecalibacterium prausnitzii]MDD7153410.1 phospho-N-acetylmuramoyl-pentapeptide-transferase [Faecalibacterium prausnitzii]MDY2682116.1 phospho-N-acetylmuramoyl-pentapeptide-transferase [Faecalibacterium prausnitzii]
MIESLISAFGQRGVDAAAFLLAFLLTALTDSAFRDRLPQDHGREFAVNGGLSKGKARGSGLIFVLCIALVSMAALPFRVEHVIYTVLLIASMLSGYFDDAAETAWNEYKKGIIDFVIAVAAGVTYLNFNGCQVHFLQFTFTLPYELYLFLIVVLIWASINVVNCTDGVDGLSASLAVVTIGTYLLAYHTELGEYATAGVVFMGALLAYLWSNAKPSTLLMGDAGSRAMGFFIAILSLKCGHPFSFLLAAVVFIVDGSLGIIKISLKRFLHISILKNTRTPLHDHVRKNKGWSDEQVVMRWLILQFVASALLLLVVRS